MKKRYWIIILLIIGIAIWFMPLPKWMIYVTAWVSYITIIWILYKAMKGNINDDCMSDEGYSPVERNHHKTVELDGKILKNKMDGDSIEWGGGWW